MVDWLIENWKILVVVVLAIVEIILVICKKNFKLTDSKMREALLKIPGYIDEAESMMPEGHGEDKLKYVLSKILHYLEVEYGEWVYDDKTLVLTITEQIEAILNTPQKKDHE